MESSISEYNIKIKYNKGYQSLPIEPFEEGLLVHIDLDNIAEDVNASKIIPSLPPQILYHSLKIKGLDNSIDVLKHLTKDQLIRILDYDAWSKDLLDPKKAFTWLKQFQKLGPQGLCSRYVALDEEYQIALIQKYITTYDEDEYNTLPEQQQDGLYSLPGNKLYYEIKSDDKEIIEFINSLIDSAISYDVSYAHLILAHASYMPPNEQEALALQFRNARLEEDGFVPFEDSFLIFKSVDIDDLQNQVNRKFNHLNNTIEPQNPITIPYDEDELFLDYVLNLAINNNQWEAIDSVELQQKFLFLGNCLCSALEIDPDDIKGLEKILIHAKALCSLGLEYLSSSSVQTSIGLLDYIHPQIFFRTGLSLIGLLQKTVIDNLESASQLKGLNKIKIWQKLGKPAEILWHIDTNWPEIIGLEYSEILKGLFNRFPMMPQKNSVQDEKQYRIKFKPIGSLKDLNFFRQTLTNLIIDLKNIPNTSL